MTREKCDGVDMATGLRDCWILTCPKDHYWRYYELHPFKPTEWTLKVVEEQNDNT